MSEKKFYGVRVTFTIGRLESEARADKIANGLLSVLSEIANIEGGPGMLVVTTEPCPFTEALRNAKTDAPRPSRPMDPNLN